VDLAQPEYNDMEKIFSHTIDKGIQLYLNPGNIEKAIRSGRDLSGKVMCL